MATLGVGGTPNADGWTYVGVVTSAAKQAILDTIGTPTGTYDIEVSTSDGSLWSPYSATPATVTVPATIRAGVPVATGAASAPTTTGIGVVVPTVTVTAASAPTLFLASHVLNTPAVAARAALVTPERPWTWLDPVTSSAKSAVISTYGWDPDTYEWEVRTGDGSLWGEWSTEIARYTIPATIAVNSPMVVGTPSAPIVGRASVDVPALAASAAPVAPIYSTQHILNAPTITASAVDIAPEPIWTWEQPVASSLAYGTFTPPADWPTGIYQFEIRTSDGTLWGEWSDPATPATQVNQSIRTPAAAGSAAAVVPKIDAGALVPSAQASGVASVPVYNVSINVLTPAVVAQGVPIAPILAIAQTLLTPSAVATGIAVRPRVTPTKTNLSIMLADGTWASVTRTILENGTWNTIDQTHVLV